MDIAVLLRVHIPHWIDVSCGNFTAICLESREIFIVWAIHPITFYPASIAHQYPLQLFTSSAALMTLWTFLSIRYFGRRPKFLHIYTSTENTWPYSRIDSNQCWWTSITLLKPFWEDMFRNMNNFTAFQLDLLNKFNSYKKLCTVLISSFSSGYFVNEIKQASCNNVLPWTASECWLS